MSVAGLSESVVGSDMRWYRVAVFILAGIIVGLVWNAVSGRGMPLAANVYLEAGDQMIDLAGAKERFDKRAALFVDARIRLVWELGHIPGALPLPEDEMESAFAELEPQLRGRYDIIVYCSGFGCEASHIVSRFLREKGIPSVVLDGGIPPWQEAGYPMKEGAQP